MKDKNAIFKYIFINILLFILLGIILYYIIKKFNFEHFISMEDIGSIDENEFPKDEEPSAKEKKKIIKLCK